MLDYNEEDIKRLFEQPQAQAPAPAGGGEAPAAEVPEQPQTDIPAIIDAVKTELDKFKDTLKDEIKDMITKTMKEQEPVGTETQPAATKDEPPPSKPSGPPGASGPSGAIPTGKNTGGPAK